MKTLLSISLATICSLFLAETLAHAQTSSVQSADSLYFDGYDCHIQGMAADTEHGYLFLSFTNVFLKADMKGNIIGTITRIPGHLGDLTFNLEDGKVYASLEFKDDEIGQGIAGVLGIEPVRKGQSRFCIAIIDVDKVDRIDISGEGNDIFKTVFLQEVTDDYNAVANGKSHKYGCSGIDGVTIAPPIGKKGGKPCLYVAYGIYSDLERDDNDNQVILCYDLERLSRYAITASYEAPASVKYMPHKQKYFIPTGNTTYGVQNLAYDPYTELFLMGVYPGQKPQYPNYSLYAFSRKQKDRRSLTLSDGGIQDKTTGIRGWNTIPCCYGIFPLGNGLWYIAEAGRTDSTGQFARIKLYHWTGSADDPFKR